MPDGDLRWELFSYHEVEALTESLATAHRVRENAAPSVATEEGHCYVHTSTSSRIDIPDLTFPNLRKRAELAVLGRVIGMSEGFFHGNPASMYELQVDRVVKAPKQESRPDTVYFVFGRAEIPVAGEMICVRNSHYPRRPTMGSRVLIFAATIPSWNPVIINAHQDEIFFEYDGDKVSMPHAEGDLVPRPTWLLINKLLSELEQDEGAHLDEGEGQ